MNCNQCKKDFPDDFGGTLCPRCDDFMYEALQEKRDYERELERREAMADLVKDYGDD